MRKDVVQMMAVGASTLVALVGSQLIPSASGIIWLIFAAALLALLYVELRKPVNYHSLVFSDQGFVFSLYQGMAEEARWVDVVDVRFFRSFDSDINEMEAEWLVDLADGRHLAVKVEFPHRRRFAREMARHVGSFDQLAAKTALRSWKEGIWHCLIRPNNALR